MHDVIAAITTAPWRSSTSSPSMLDADGARPRRRRDRDRDVLGARPRAAGRLLRRRVAGRERLARAPSRRLDAEGRQRLQEGLLGAGERHAVLRAARPGERRLDVAEVELDDLRVLRMLVRLVPEQVLAAVGLDERDALRACGRSGAGSRASARRPGRSRTVAPYSGDMFPSVARSATVRLATPSPKYSTNLPTTPVRRSSSVTVRTRSVAVAPSRSRPERRKPTTCGTSIESGSPSIAASASIPPTPQPSTPRPLTIVVCESGPTSVSGKATPSAALDDAREVLEVHLVADPGAGRHDLEVAERRLAPAQERVALAVALDLELDVPREREPRGEQVDLHRVVDHELGRDQRVDPRRVAAELGDRVAHRRQVDDGRDAREVLQQDARGEERDLLRRLGMRIPASRPRGAGLVARAQHVLEQHAERVRQRELALELRDPVDRGRRRRRRSGCPCRSQSSEKCASRRCAKLEALNRGLIPERGSRRTARYNGKGCSRGTSSGRRRGSRPQASGQGSPSPEPR